MASFVPPASVTGALWWSPKQAETRSDIGAYPPAHPHQPRTRPTGHAHPTNVRPAPHASRGRRARRGARDPRRRPIRRPPPLRCSRRTRTCTSCSATWWRTARRRGSCSGSWSRTGPRASSTTGRRGRGRSRWGRGRCSRSAPSTRRSRATVLADMVAKGEVALDDPVQKYLPASVRVPSRNGRQITLLDLATHRSGLPRLPSNFAPADRDQPVRRLHRRTALRVPEQPRAAARHRGGVRVLQPGRGAAGPSRWAAPRGPISRRSSSSASWSRWGCG